MTRERLYLFDTTLRDGAQTTGVDFSLEDKRLITRTLDEIGIDYIEGGYPGANPTDTEFFSADPGLANATFTAFGMTKRAGRSVSNDPGFQATLQAHARRHLPGGEGLGLSRARGARHLQRGEPGRHHPVDRGRGEERPRGHARLRAFLRRLQGQSRLRAGRGDRRPTRRARAGWCCATPTAARCRTRSRPSSPTSASTCRARTSASTPTTTPRTRSPTRWRPCAPARARSRARSTGWASAAATPTSPPSSRRCC